MLFLILALLISKASAQRPDGAPLCDYYAGLRYGSSKIDSDAQYHLIQDIVVLAFGGRFNISKYPSNLTGILNPGTYENLGVNLLPWFDGSKLTTNSNGNALGVNWLDGGGLTPLYKYTSGQANKLILPNTTNQFGLFGRFFVSFSQFFNCTHTPAPPPTSDGEPDSTTLNVAYVHKFMDLNQTDLAHFINQLSIATASVGFEIADSQNLTARLNGMFNVRCAPLIRIPPSTQLQLPSLCQDEQGCPLAYDNDCAAYATILPNGVSGATMLPNGTTGNHEILSKGGIASIAIGGAFFLTLFIAGATILFRRLKHRSRVIEPRYVPPPSEYTAPPPNEHRMTTTTLGYDTKMYPPELPSPETKKGKYVAEMESPAHSPRVMGNSGGGMSPVEIGDGERRGDGIGHWMRG